MPAREEGAPDRRARHSYRVTPRPRSRERSRRRRSSADRLPSSSPPPSGGANSSSWRRLAGSKVNALRWRVPSGLYKKATRRSSGLKLSATGAPYPGRGCCTISSTRMLRHSSLPPQPPLLPATRESARGISVWRRGFLRLC